MSEEKIGCALVTAIGSFSASVAIASLRRLGFSVVGCDIYPRNWVANALDVDEFYQVPLAAEGDAYVAALREIVRRESVRVVIPSTDFEIDALIGRRDEVGATICMSSDECLGLCRDKFRTFCALKDHVADRNLIPTLLVSEADLTSLTYPAICKPRGGRSSSGLFCATGAEDVIRKVDESSWEQYCIQPKLEGRVVTVDVLREGNTVLSMPRRELLRTLNGAGTSVEVFEDEGLQELCSLIAETLDVEGCVNFEFLEQERGLYRFIECNPRLSGGVAFSNMSGYDFVGNHVRHFVGIPVEKEIKIMNQFIARRYVECAMNDLEEGDPHGVS